MGRGVSAGGGQSSLGYLFGSGEAPKPAAQAAASPPPADNEPPKPVARAPASPQVDITKQIPAGIHGNPANNYHRADGQNTGNFLTDRPSTKVHAAPGGGSSLGYLFGGNSN
ncbi:hypothetical protein MKX03_021033 [Papaver bracteatum]|nr:hypothetical protein MKX03_021033 [Papaver bracteatum]KAI3892010.1 hypothetical protein MKW92_004801 [Papaver armeniacum]KAI3950602.1 hypothetical protein MKW92_006393 [Papaver armeniacum]